MNNMNEKNALNIVHKKSINGIGHSLIIARRAIESENADLHLSAQQLLRLVLLGCFFAELFQRKNNEITNNIPEAITFATVCEYTVFVESENWVQNYLHISDEEILQLRIDTAYRAILQSAEASLFASLLPYALELLEYSEEDLLGATTDRRKGIVTEKKKHKGIFYTPADVAAYMVNNCVNLLVQKDIPLLTCRFIDFSCGSGVFLLQVIESIAGIERFNDFNDYFQFIQTSLFGIDLSDHAVECTRYTIFAFVARVLIDSKMNAELLFRVLERNIIRADATNLQQLYLSNPEYPQHFECIVGNPPYAMVGLGNLFIPFVNNLIEHSATCSVSSLVLPLSFSYNNQLKFVNLRERIQSDVAEWRIEHYDRSPDSLFGDDVKSRNCIVFRIQGGDHSQRFATGLLRWTSKTRAQLLSVPKNLANITEFSMSKYIPKLSTEIERDVFHKVILKQSPIINHLSIAPSLTETRIAIKGTAYNWICAYDHIPHGEDEDGCRYISKELKLFTTRTDSDVYFVIAMLNSIFSFWYWTVIGDGFHITNRYLASLCIESDCFTAQQYEKAVTLGKVFCEKITQFPSQSVNSGKVITNYDHTPLLNHIEKIDQLIAEALELPDKFPDYLRTWYSNIVSCGR